MASEHMAKGYDEELNKLNNTITEMGGLAESQLGAAIEAVIERDSELAASVVEGDVKVDQLQNANRFRSHERQKINRKARRINALNGIGTLSLRPMI